uniref:Transposase n=1 Tax=Arabidopsis lyrata subsp. lyrata TaxID=81972 RepID=B2BXI4_ARALL|nr:transposase [Arabidopsis lyrata subsp. lyrata]
MANVSVREMTSKFGKLDKFEGVDFRRWQKKMHFLLTTLNVVHVLSMPMPTVSENGCGCRIHTLNAVTSDSRSGDNHFDRPLGSWVQWASSFMGHPLDYVAIFGWSRTSGAGSDTNN